MTAWIGYVGLVAFALAWVPQSWETVREGRCGANRAFLALSALGSVSLTAYAFLRDDTVFASLNALTSLGAMLNIYFSLFPRGSGRNVASREVV
ncbi:MAG: lipid-A-disaccharide synthase N-terminal domain-containing protein [Elusimicrobia bacterium]|nr:lipid-A-disaccharide synthase N-terminal domain-containing protein [Elusimicrobiota bacterium]